MEKILVIDDEAPIRKILEEILSEEGYDVSLAEDGEKGEKLLLEGSFDLALCDLKMPKKDGLEVLEKVLEADIPTQMIMISGHGDIETAVEAVRKGAFDFMEKPLDLNKILISVRNALDKRSLVTETKKLKKRVAKTFDIIGESTPIVQIKETLEKVAPTDARVLITGENGTGKELVARWLHELSARIKEPFVEVNCAAIPSELIESELFGHEKGAFTSAIKQRKGKFEQAHGGTLFLDEIGDMPAAAQAKVLRALQENTIQRVGGDKNIKVNTRVIAATNKDLKKEIEEGNFREDLYHRISVIRIHVPPLRERKDDIPLLVDKFLKDIGEEYGSKPKSMKKEALQALKDFEWSGNIRELRNVVERLVILGGQEISGEDVKKYTVF